MMKDPISRRDYTHDKLHLDKKWGIILNLEAILSLLFAHMWGLQSIHLPHRLFTDKRAAQLLSPSPPIMIKINRSKFNFKKIPRHFVWDYINPFLKDLNAMGWMDPVTPSVKPRRNISANGELFFWGRKLASEEQKPFFVELSLSPPSPLPLLEEDLLEESHRIQPFAYIFSTFCVSYLSLLIWQ